MAPGHVRVKSPVRTPARKSVVGSPKRVTTSPTRIKSPPPVEHVKSSTYADQMDSTKSKIASDHAPPKPEGWNPPVKRSPVKFLGSDSRYVHEYVVDIAGLENWQLQRIPISKIHLDPPFNNQCSSKLPPLKSTLQKSFNPPNSNL